MQWPNNEEWNALSSNLIQVIEGKYQLSTVNCGKLKIPSGKLICCDPFAGMDRVNNAFINIPKGEYEVIVTLADVSANLDGSHIREAYASLIIDSSKKEVLRKCLQPTKNGEPSGDILSDGEYFGFGVDAGTACFVDAESLLEGMPQDNWYEDLFENDKDDNWFNQMDDPNLIRNGLANIKLPDTKSDNNLILFHSGWGDGFYPVIGGYDEEGALVAVHIDFFVVSSPVEPDEAINGSIQKKPWWKFW